MSGCEVEWVEVPTEVSRAARPIFHRFLRFTPSWCHDLTISYGDGEEGKVACCTSQPEYRQAHITLFGGWLAEKATRRRRAVVHELSHLFTAPLDAFVGKLIEQIPDPAVRATMAHTWEGLVEGTTCDVARAIDEASGA